MWHKAETTAGIRALLHDYQDGHNKVINILKLMSLRLPFWNSPGAYRAESVTYIRNEP